MDRKREAPAVFKHAGQYFMLTSGCQGWDASAMEAFVARCTISPETHQKMGMS